MPLTQFVQWFFQSPTPKTRRACTIVKLAILVGLFMAMFWVVLIEQVIQALLSADPSLVAA